MKSGEQTNDTDNEMRLPRGHDVNVTNKLKEISLLKIKEADDVEKHNVTRKSNQDSNHRTNTEHHADQNGIREADDIAIISTEIPGEADEKRR